MPELDVVFPLINYAGLGIRKGNDFGDREEMMAAIEACHRAGKGVFSMKAFGGGSLTGHYQQALDYVFSQPAIDSVMIGFGKTAEVDDILAYLDGTMPADYNPDVSKKKVYINQEDCEGCGACKAACPAGAIQIGSFALLELFIQDYWIPYLVSLVLSILWNFTLNRRYTFKSAANVPVAMAKVFGFYLVFTPLSTYLGDLAEGYGVNDFIILIVTMLANFVLEYLFCKLVVYRGKEDTL